ncbi:MAG TPA: response regulator transcription factor [Caulobacteraceae bacterium]|nr:response regulator transcription factor [Caulobacteraceae bacterium]
MSMTPDIQASRVLLVDDDGAANEMLREYLETEGFFVSVAETGAEGLAAALSGAYEAVVLDVMLPQMNGIEVLRRLRLESQIPVIMLTAKGDNVDKVVGLELGADDYVAKPYFPRELVARLRAVLRRHPAAAAGHPATLSLGTLEAETESRRAHVNGKALRLTTSEFNILVMLLRSRDRVSTKEELSLKVLGRARSAYDRSIDAHVSNLRQKLHAAGCEAEIETVRGLGYRLTEAVA